MVFKFKLGRVNAKSHQTVVDELAGQTEPKRDGLSEEAFAAIGEIAGKLQLSPKVIFVAGCHDGSSTLRYLELFPNAKIYCFEPESQNFDRAASNLLKVKSQVKLFPFCLTESCGELLLNVNSHDATHSIFDIGKIELWDGFTSKIESRLVTSVTIDSIMESEGIKNIDILHLDIQGAELLALQGASEALSNSSITLIRCEVEFEQIYAEQPLFWDIGSYLSQHNYRFIKNVDLKYRRAEIPRLVWADAIFLPN
jgi:FkbM family methyltransferase